MGGLCSISRDGKQSRKENFKIKPLFLENVCVGPTTLPLKNPSHRGIKDEPKKP